MAVPLSKLQLDGYYHELFSCCVQCFFEAHNLRRAYWHFMRRTSWGRVLQFNYDELDKFGTGASTEVRKWREKQQRGDRADHSHLQPMPSEEVGQAPPPPSSI